MASKRCSSKKILSLTFVSESISKSLFIKFFRLHHKWCVHRACMLLDVIHRYFGLFRFSRLPLIVFD